LWLLGQIQRLLGLRLDHVFHALEELELFL
jgi:hypothetical protein